VKFFAFRSIFCEIQIELLPLMKPITSATEYFGGIETSLRQAKSWKGEWHVT
jgi:hypothetical protein